MPLLATTPPLLFAIFRFGFVGDGIYFRLEATPHSMRQAFLFNLLACFGVAQGRCDEPVHFIVDGVASQTNRALDCQCAGAAMSHNLSLIHISEPTRLLSISYAVF